MIRLRKNVAPVLIACCAISSMNVQAFSGDLKKWKITIPDSEYDFYGSGSKTKAAELAPERCDSTPLPFDASTPIIGSTGVVFFDMQNDQAHFRADLGGGVTTPNTSYIRAELRELFNVDYDTSNPCSTSTAETSWQIVDAATQTHTHTLSSILTVAEHPESNVIDDLPKVIVGQVHGWEIKQALVKMQWEGSERPVRAILNQNFFKDNIECTDDLAEKTGCDKWPFSVELGTYEKGEEWRYDITIDSDGIYLMTQDSNGQQKVEYDMKWGEEFLDKDGNRVTLVTDWTDDDVAFYFKAGIYPQIRPDTAFSGQRFDVGFSQINLFHR
ncbi:polysaccharide lyase family 7 protein [Agarivorans sp. B2Z047]|uniref:polysaccharide lyase family 7 protein n=2 Tax=Agarivorans sp. B2Z047 TaxID=2652721 RepID=UPI002019A5FC|nr:polysaccharide lyase family 7 protein [Agarivorans sp. B2Z047]UQN40985.1 polysaccharide lyase family 7 protein [Agarivorans sp. B2Z047]